MSALALRLEHPPDLRVDLRDVDSRTLASLAPGEAARFRVRHGNESAELGAFFRIDAVASDAAGPELRFDGDLSRFDRIGWKLAEGRIVVDGAAGDYVGSAMSGGEIVIDGDAGVCAACAMTGGRITIRGDVGDFAASAFPGDMEGMRGGTLVVDGNAGARLADRMRRGTVIVAGDVGVFAGSRMVAGTIGIGGRAAEHAGFGMRRGSMIFAGEPPTPDVTFLPVAADIGVIWRLLARDLARFGDAFARLPAIRPRRYVGDLGAGGKGELLLAS